MDVKESNEMLDLAEGLVKVLLDAKADGTINWLDMPKFAPLLPLANRALSGSEKIVDEFLDLDGEEATALAERAMNIIILLIGTHLPGK